MPGVIYLTDMLGICGTVVSGKDKVSASVVWQQISDFTCPNLVLSSVFGKG